jgi:hypothetical protein
MEKLHCQAGRYFSPEQFVFAEVPGKLNQKIMLHLMQIAIQNRSWFVRADLEKLSQLHEGGKEYTVVCLERLRSLRLIVKICQTKHGWLFLIPTLTSFVSEPQEKRRRGKERLVHHKLLGASL